MMGILRKRDGGYFVPEPDPDPVLIIREGGALVDPEWLSEEVVRETAKEEQQQARLQAEREMAEQDAIRAREEEESMARFYEERMQTELPEHLKGRDVDA